MTLETAIQTLKTETQQWGVPIVTEIQRLTNSPYKVLISCILSLRTKDEVTAQASARLYKLGNTPAELMQVAVAEIEKAIYPVGFYHTKAQQIVDISRRLVEEFGGEVPQDIDTLVTFKGVGRKTANLVVTVGYGLPGICVDTHVHRITNRWGYVQTKTPDKTELALREKLPRKYWLVINDLLVTYGQNLCKPISPLCSICKLSSFCKKIGVAQSR